MKKIICLLLAIAITTTICAASYLPSNKTAPEVMVEINTNSMTVKNTSSENLNALANFSGNKTTPINSTTSNENDSNLNLSFSLKNTNEEDLKDCIATGVFRVKGAGHSFNVSGQVSRVHLDNGNTVLIGGLTGDLDAGKEISDTLSLVLCYNESTKESYLPLCVGTYGIEGTPPLLVEFGKPFYGLSEATLALQEETSNDQTVETEEIIAQETLSPLSVDPSVRCLNAITTYYSQSAVMFSYLYGSKEATPSGSWRQTIKAQVNVSNFAKKYNANLPPITGNGGGSQISTTQGHNVKNIWLYYSNSNNACRIVDPKPSAQQSSISLITPTFFIPWGPVAYIASYTSIPISISGISHSYSNNNSSLQTKIWSSNGIAKLKTSVTTLSNGYNSKDGVSVDFTVFNGLSAGKSTTATFYPKAEISFTEIALDGSIAPRVVTITGNKISHSLYSKT